jgi:hypothetical protein
MTARQSTPSRLKVKGFDPRFGDGTPAHQGHMTPVPHALVVGDRAHRIAAAVTRLDLPEDRVAVSVALAKCAADVFRAHPIVKRSREAVVDAATAAGVYFHRFRPLDDWVLVGTEMVVERHRLDLVFASPTHGVVVDELKLGVGRAHEATVRTQIDSYLDLGCQRWGTRFLGVRLCAVHEPMASRFYMPGHKRSALLTDECVAESLRVR